MTYQEITKELEITESTLREILTSLKELDMRCFEEIGKPLSHATYTYEELAKEMGGSENKLLARSKISDVCSLCHWIINELAE